MDKPADSGIVLTRRRFLEAAAIAPLALRGRGARTQDELTELGAREAVQRIRRGDVKVEAYVAALLSQSNQHKDLNLITSIDEARVLEAARAVDRARARGARLGAAAGLPFAVKNQIEVAGYPATAGNAALKSYVPARHAVVVERLVTAGAIPFCMTTLPDMIVDDGLMHQASSHSDAFGAVRNPYDRTRIAGGSSGGSAAVLAARIVPAALGADANGSIRCPAAFCGVAGLRPSTFTIDNAVRGTRRKRYSDEGLFLMFPPSDRLYTIGPMARTAADVAFLHTLITGQSIAPVDLRNIRIGVPAADHWDREMVDTSVASLIRQVFAKLRDAGCHLVEMDFLREVSSIVGTFENPTLASVVAESGLGAPTRSRDVTAAWLRAHAPQVKIEDVYRGRPSDDPPFPTLPPPHEQRTILTQASRRYAEIFRAHRVSALAFPTIPIAAPPIRHGGPKEPFGEMITVNGQQAEEGKVLMRNLVLAPRMGAPGLSVPIGLAQGLPVGLELDALPGHDRELLGLGIAVENVVGRLPPPTFR